MYHFNLPVVLAGWSHTKGVRIRSELQFHGVVDIEAITAGVTDSKREPIN